MADAATAARDRVERALATLETRLAQVRARPADARDLFGRVPDVADADGRLKTLEDAGREASEALAEAASALRALTEEPG